MADTENQGVGAIGSKPTARAVSWAISIDSNALAALITAGSSGMREDMKSLHKAMTALEIDAALGDTALGKDKIGL